MQPKKNLNEVASLFEHAGDIIAIRLEYSDTADFGVDAVANLQEELQKRIGKTSGSKVLLVPSSDGVLIVTEDSGTETNRKILEEVQSSLVSDYSESFNVDTVVVEQIGFGRVDSAVKTMPHEEFVTLDMHARVQTLLTIEQTLRGQAFDFRKVLKPANVENIGYFVTLPNLPQSPAQQRGHIRDPYYNPSPYLAGVDVATMYNVVSFASTEMEKGNLSKYYLPFNFQCILDQRYWPFYKNEINNVPQYLRKFVVVELVRIPPGTPETRIVEGVTRMMNLCENVVVSVNSQWSTLNFSRLNHVSEVTIYPIEIPDDVAAANQTAQRVCELAKRASSIGYTTKSRKSIISRLSTAARGGRELDKRLKFDLLIM